MLCQSSAPLLAACSAVWQTSANAGHNFSTGLARLCISSVQKTDIMHKLLCAFTAWGLDDTYQLCRLGLLVKPLDLPFAASIVQLDVSVQGSCLQTRGEAVVPANQRWLS